jgi:hypothetical protein
MDFRQHLISRVISSTAVCIFAFCLTFPLVGLLGNILFNPQQGHAFFSPQEATLFLISFLMGLTVGIVAGIKYYRFLGKSK